MAQNAKAPAGGHYHHGDLRATLINAAESLLREQGSWTFTLREVARVAGVSHNAPYNHFPDKRALLAAVAARAFSALRQSLSDEIAAVPGTSISSRIERAAVAYVMFAVDKPARFRLMFSGELAGSDFTELTTAAKDAFSELEELIARGVERGELRSDAFESHALSAWSLVHGLSSLILDKRVGGDRDRESLRKMAGIVGRTLIDGIAPK